MHVDRITASLRSRRIVSMLVGAAAVVSLAAGQLSLALFTDQETVAGAFSSGSVVLHDVKIDALTLSTSGMLPGDTVTDDVVVENDGTVQLRYSLSTSSTNADSKGLRDVLTLTEKAIDDAGRALRRLRRDVDPRGHGARSERCRLRQPDRRFAGRRPHARCGCERDALLPGQPSVVDSPSTPSRPRTTRRAAPG